MKTKRDLEEILKSNAVLEEKYIAAFGMAQEIQNQIQHEMPNLLALHPLLKMISDYAFLLRDKQINHGTNLYSRGCRCPVCVQKKKEWHEMYKEVKKARKRS